MRQLAPLCLCALIAGACDSTSNREEELRMLAAYDAQYSAELEAFEREQAHVRRTTQLPLEYHFEGVGDLYVSECELLGRPRKAYMRIDFTYVNTTGRTVPSPRVSMRVVDPKSDEEAMGWIDLITPFTTLSKESCYTSWLEVPTDGLHFRPGWRWEVAVDFTEPFER